jgi:hypothetical protein
MLRSSIPPPRPVNNRLPHHLRTLAHVDGEATLNDEGRAEQRSVLDALEARYPMLRGTIREHVTHQRRPFARFFACEQDRSHEPPYAPLPDAVASGADPCFVGDALAWLERHSSAAGAARRTRYSREP